MKRIAMYLLATVLLGPATLLMVGGARYAMSRWLNAPIESQEVGGWSLGLSIFVIGLHAVGTVMLSDWTANRKAAKESPMSETINERVAREIMGWTVVRDVRFWDHSQPMPAFVQYAEGRWGVIRTGGSSYEPFKPDSDHNDAHAVVEKMRQSLRVDISDIRSYPGWHDGGWKVHFWGESSGVDADPVVAPTLPLAICKAALAAKGATNGV